MSEFELLASVTIAWILVITSPLVINILYEMYKQRRYNSKLNNYLEALKELNDINQNVNNLLRSGRERMNQIEFDYEQLNGTAKQINYKLWNTTD